MKNYGDLGGGYQLITPSLISIIRHKILDQPHSLIVKYNTNYNYVLSSGDNRPAHSSQTVFANPHHLLGEQILTSNLKCLLILTLMKGSYKLPVNCPGVHKVRFNSIINTHDMTCQVKNRPLALRGHMTNASFKQ